MMLKLKKLLLTSWYHIMASSRKKVNTLYAFLTATEGKASCKCAVEIKF